MEKVRAGIDEGEDPSSSKVDLRTSIMKPIHAQWLMDIHQIVAQKPEVIITGFAKAGILDAASLSEEA